MTASKHEKDFCIFFGPFIKSSFFPIGLNHFTIVILTSNSFNQDFSNCFFSNWKFSAFLALSAIPIQLFSILTAVSQKQLFLVVSCNCMYLEMKTSEWLLSSDTVISFRPRPAWGNSSSLDPLGVTLVGPGNAKIVMLTFFTGAGVLTELQNLPFPRFTSRGWNMPGNCLQCETQNIHNTR